ncbi:DMT family transporter [Candidatus Kaiserbacteria bacterium]|nr:DMT family transporter [Candidatus Kaiserbacteria bacterium]
MSKLTWTFLLVGSMAAIAAFYPMVKILHGAIDPYLLAFFRFAIALLALLPIMAVRHSLKPPPIREWPIFVFIGLCGATASVLVIIGIGQTNSVVSAILLNTNPLLVALLAPFLITEQLTPTKIAALVVGFVGVVLVVLNGQNLSALVSSEYFWGAVIVLVAALFSGLNKIYSKRPVRTYDGLYVTFFGVALGTVMLGTVVAISGIFAEPVELTLREWIFVVAIGVFSSAIPWTIWNSSLKHLDVHVAASFMLLIPVFATLYSLIFLTESITPWMVVGMILTSVGIYFVQREESVSATSV